MASWVVVAAGYDSAELLGGLDLPASAGDTFTVDLTISDGDVAGVLHLPGGDITGSVVGDAMSFDVPADTPEGDYTVTFTAR